MMLHLQWVWALAWLWMMVSAEDAYKGNYTGNCYPTSSAYSLESKILCGIVCATKECVLFTYLDRICTVYGAGASEGSADNSHFYRRFTLKEIANPLTNMAFNKPTLPTIVWGSHYASLAVDNDPESQYHSKDRNSAWWSVDLEAFYYIREVTVQPTPNVASRFRAVKIYAGSTEVTDGDFSSYTEIVDFPGTYSSASGRLSFPVTGDVCARYVAIQGSVDFLNLRDVEVFV